MKELKSTKVCSEEEENITRGRLLQANRMPPARRNYGNRVQCPWVFCLIWHKRDGCQELHMFHVLRRDERTLRRIVERNVSGGPHIYSDECQDANMQTNE